VHRTFQSAGIGSEPQTEVESLLAKLNGDSRPERAGGTRPRKSAVAPAPRPLPPAAAPIPPNMEQVQKTVYQWITKLRIASNVIVNPIFNRLRSLLRLSDPEWNLVLKFDRRKKLK
jgi:hypothetical protein